MKNFILTLFLFFIIKNSWAIENDSTRTDKIKTGWNFGFLPVITYNSDLGLQYGGLTNIYYYGKGDIYPAYYHSIYAEISRYTKGSGIYRLFYDSKYFIKNIRTTFDFCYLPDQALDFYGFNGAQSMYIKNWEDDSKSEYKSRMYYHHERNVLRFKADFQGSTSLNNLYWASGLEFNNVEVRTVDIDKLNEGKSASDQLPDTATLYDDYVSWGIIKNNEKSGGFLSTLKAGVVFDTRDNEPNAMRGVWTEIVIAQTLNNEYNFTKLAITHRQYFTLVKNNLSFAYRLCYQGKIAGNIPFYALPTLYYSYTPSSNSDGLGGSKTIRGVVRNRVVGEGVVFGNFELRWKFIHFNFLKQNIYLALSPFIDAGQVVQLKDIDKSQIPEYIDQNLYFSSKKDKMHFTYGSGFHIAMNQNFVISADYGVPFEKQDGNKGIYIVMNFLF